MVTAAGGNGFDVFVDDLPSTNDQNRTRFEGVAYVSTGTDAVLESTIDRATGNLTVNNTTGSPRSIIRYAIGSAAGGARRPRNGTALRWAATPRLQKPMPGPSPRMAQLFQAIGCCKKRTVGRNDGEPLTANTGTFNLGNVWIKSPFEDALVSLELVGDKRRANLTADVTNRRHIRQWRSRR